MTVARRLTAVETALTPTELTLCWLDEVQAAGDLNAHLGWLIEQPEAKWPLVRLPREAEAAVRASMHGQPKETVTRAVRQAVADVVFRIALIFRLSVTIDAATELAELLNAFLVQRLGVVSLQARVPGEPDGPAGYADWLHLATTWLVGLRATEAARRDVERRYLAGHDGLLPPCGERWADRLAEGTETVFRGIRVVELEAPEALATEVPLPEPTAAAVSAIAERIVDGARLEAFSRLGEEAAAQAVARRWLTPTPVGNVDHIIAANAG